MKRLNVFLLGGLTGLLLSACTRDMDQPGLNPEGELVRIQLDAPEAMQLTRSVAGTNSANGGLTNVDWTKYDLRYQLAVYSEDGSKLLMPAEAKVYDTYSSTTFEFRLTPNNTYKFVAWADFVSQGETGDLHYNTSDLSNISILDGVDGQINDESRDAYFVNKDISIDQTFNESLTLKRPFAKVRVVTTDWVADNEGIGKPDNFKVAYHDCKRFSGLNVVTGEAVGEGDATSETVYTAAIMTDSNGDKFYAEGYDASAANRTLLVDYLVAKNEQQAIHFNIEMLAGETTVISRDFKTEIPIQRNYLTTIIGNLLSVGGAVDIDIDDSFTNEWVEGEEWWNGQSITPKEPAYDEATKTYEINTRDEFAWLVDNEKTVEGKTVSINNDIDMSGVDWSPIYTQGEIGYTVEGNGHVLRNFSVNGAKIDHTVGSGWLSLKLKAFVGVWGKFTGVMRDLTFENITINGIADSQLDPETEYAYFAGCVGYAGSNYSSAGQFENVHAKHVVIRASKGSITQNIGGLAGWLGTGGGQDPNWTVYMKDCSAEDIHITGYQAGGLVGEVKADRGVGFVNCSTKDVYIRIKTFLSEEEAVSGFIGNIIAGNNVVLRDCSVAENVMYYKDNTGNIADYAPANDYYGFCESGTPKIQTTQP